NDVALRCLRSPNVRTRARSCASVPRSVNVRPHTFSAASFSLQASILRQLCSGFHCPSGQCCTWYVRFVCIVFPRCLPRCGGYKSFLATIGPHASTIVNSRAAVLPLSKRGRGARRRPFARAAILPLGVVNGFLTRPKSAAVSCAGLALGAGLPSGRGSRRRKAGRLRSRQLVEVLQPRQARAAP